MKKKYYAPEMEELELDEPVILSDKETSGGTEGACDGITIDPDDV